MEESSLATAYIQAQRAAEKREASALLAAVREAVVTASTDSHAFRADVTRSTQRFEEIATVSPVIELQTRLRAEVHVLKSKITESQSASRSNGEALAKRIQTLELQLREARQESSVDPLTGAANRTTFNSACQDWLGDGLTQFSVLMIDVDDFKTINDTYGHFAGDHALTTVGAALRTAARSHQDIVARIGGDEFAIMAKDLPLRAAEGLFARVVAALESREVTENAPSLPVTLSGGAAEFSAGDTVRSLLQRADEALYEAKRRGKNRVVAKAKPLLRDL
jgi:diguanylate cyclase